MGVFNFLSSGEGQNNAPAKSINVSESASSKIYNRAVFEFMSRFGIPANYDLEKLVNYYSSNSLIYALMDWKGQKSSQIKPLLFKIKDNSSASEYRKWNGKYTGEYEHKKLNILKKSAFEEIHFNIILESSEYWKLKKLFTRPNEWMTFKQLMYSYSAYMDGCGHALIYGQKVTGGFEKNKSVGLFMLPAQYMTIQGGTEYKPIGGYSFDMFGAGKQFDAKDVMHLQSFSFDYDKHGSQLLGTSRVRAALSEILTFIAAKDREYYSYNTGDSATLLMPKDANNLPENLMSVTGIQAFKDKILKALKQKDRHNVTVLTTAMEALKIDSPLKDSNTTEAKKEIKQNLASIWHLSNRVVLGSSDGSTYNNMKEEIKTSLRDGVFPDLIQLCEKLNEFEIYPNYKNHELAFDYDVYPELSEDFGTQIKYLKDADFLSDDEKREWINYDSLNLPNSNIPTKYWKKQNTNQPL